jgi:hypothetical protein
MQEYFMNTKLYVGNLPFDTKEAALQALFENSGGVSTVTIVRDRATGQARGSISSQSPKGNVSFERYHAACTVRAALMRSLASCRRSFVRGIYDVMPDLGSRPGP